MLERKQEDQRLFTLQTSTIPYYNTAVFQGSVFLLYMYVGSKHYFCIVDSATPSNNNNTPPDQTMPSPPSQ